MLTEGKQSGSNVEIRAAGFILSNLSNLSVIFELDAKKIFNLREGEREREREREREKERERRAQNEVNFNVKSPRLISNSEPQSLRDICSDSIAS